MQTLNNRWRRSPKSVHNYGFTDTRRSCWCNNHGQKPAHQPRHAHMPGSTRNAHIRTGSTYIRAHTRASSQTAGTSPFGVVKHTLRKGWKQPSYTQDGTLSPVADIAEDTAGERGLLESYRRFIYRYCCPPRFLVPVGPYNPYILRSEYPALPSPRISDYLRHTSNPFAISKHST